MIRNLIKNGDVNNSLKELCKILSENTNINNLEDDFIFICDYIAKHIEHHHSTKYIDIIKSASKFISNDSILIDETLVLCCKMCLLCKELYDVPTIHMKTLRQRTISDLQMTLTPLYSKTFENILPIPTSKSYPVACNITMCFVNYLNKIKDIDPENKEFIILTNRLRLCIEYITRKDVYIENTESTQGECIWFLWTLISKLTQSQQINDLHEFFITKWKSNCKKKRIGILWSTVFFIKYSHNDWTDKEYQTFEKIKSISSQLMDEMKPQTNSCMSIINDFVPTNKNQTMLT